MTPIRTALATVLLAVAVSACGGSPAPAGADPAGTPAPVAAPAPTGAPAEAGTAEAAVAEVFQRYYRALLARDFGTACALNAPETKAAMLDNLATQGGIRVSSCEEGFQRIYAVPAAAELADRIATTAQVGEVTVTGDQASITWTAQVREGTQTVTNRMRRVDGQWQLLDTDS